MGKRISIRVDLSVEELERRYRQAQDPVARSQWQIVWLLARGRPSEQVGETTGYSLTWVYTVARRYNTDGARGIGDGRHGNPGGPRILSPEQQAELDRAREGAAPDGGRWTAGGGRRAVDGGAGGGLDRAAYGTAGGRPNRLALSASARVAPLSAASSACQGRPRGPSGLQANTLSEQVAAVQATSPEAQVEGWATDEHRVGLKPILGRVWARKGKRPIVRVQHRFAWRYVLAFVHPASGRTEWQFAAGINTAGMSVAVEYFARAVGAGPTKRIVLVLDQAGYHTSPLGQVPEGIQLVFLPPSSPELQPAEHLWHYSDQPLINQPFATIDDLEDAVANHCDRLQRQRDVIRSATLFHWWPAV